MKKVKIMLSAIAVLAIVGGALAFKAKDDNFCWYKKVNPTFCPLAGIPETFVVTGPGSETVIAIPPTGCPEATSTTLCTLTFDLDFN